MTILFVVKEKKICLVGECYGRIYPFDHFSGSINQGIIHKIGFKASS